jgi:hypothetical protein
MTGANTELDAALWVAIVLAIFAIVLVSVGGVLRRAPSDSGTGAAGIWVFTIGVALAVTAAVILVAGATGLV